ncbi:MAG: hypothetical protein EOO40_00655 [Deltaproteobacteria bacterium]|nr:MAG: hypothetical protein EOO40_00655 [Deltaproteobacteria bacterium]
MSYTPVKGTCGCCIAYVGDPPGGERGRCLRRPELGLFDNLLRRCPKYVEKGTGARYSPPKVARAPRQSTPSYTAPVAPKQYGPTIDLEGETPMDTQALRALLTDVLRQEGLVGETAIAKKFVGGSLVIRPADPNLQDKAISLEAFFNKVVMVRDRLRVLEQKLNGHQTLSQAEKVDLQQYITRIYGSLTTFNVLFSEKADQFVGSKSDS